MGPKNRATNWHYIRFGTISDGTITGMHCSDLLECTSDLLISPFQSGLLQDPGRGAQCQQEPDQEGVPQAGQGDAPRPQPGRPRCHHQVPRSGHRLRDALR